MFRDEVGNEENDELSQLSNKQLKDLLRAYKKTLAGQEYLITKLKAKE